MSQQEFMPQSQSQGQQFAENDAIETDDLEQSAVLKAQQAKVTGKALPKDEPLSSYDEPMTLSNYNRDYQQGYTSQAHASNTHQQSRGGTTTGQASHQYYYSPDGDAHENQYRPYYGQTQHYQQWNTPVWARPQQRRRSGMSVFWLIILGLLFIGPLMHLLGILFAVIGIVFLLIFVPFVLFMVFGLPWLIMRAISGPFMGAGMRRSNFWMGYRPGRRGIWW
jgi:hypothetical protein